MSKPQDTSALPIAQRIGAVARIGAASLLLLWIICIYIYLLRSNTVLLPSEERPLGIFSGLFGSWSFSLENTPPLEFFQSLVALALTQVFGVLTLRALRVRLPLLAEHAIAFPIGFGLSGVAIELLTMARLLYPLPLWLLWAVLIGGTAWIVRRGGWQTGEEALFPEQDDEHAGEGLTKFPAAIGPKLFTIAALILTALITAATFWHGIFYPESYWDTLILYLGYARMTFLEHAFPFKAEAQVGIGLGANYPHIFSTYGAMASTLFNHWSDLPQRLAAPLAGLAACALVYFSVLDTWRRHDLAAAAALLFRSVPNGIAYTTWASDYAFAILFCAAFIYAFVRYARRPRLGEYAILTLIPAVSMHLNFLMGILWIPWVVGVVGVSWMKHRQPLTFSAITAPLRSRRAWAIYGIGIAIALPWYIRNTVLTGNPVYAFFPEIFTASVRVNPEVLRSAELEWYRLGDGIAKTAELFYDLEEGVERDQGAPDFQRAAGLEERLASSFLFWVGFDVVRIQPEGLSIGSWIERGLHLLRWTRNELAAPPRLDDSTALLRWNHAYKMAPLFPGLVFPALLYVFVFLLPASIFLLRTGRLRDPVPFAVTALSGFVCLLLLAYMYLLADFYLYQIIGILAPATIVAAALLHWMIATPWAGGAFALIIGGFLVVQGLVPGLAFGLMNFKVFHRQTELFAFRNPGMSPAEFYRYRFGADPDMWDYINENLPAARLLTHENRHYVFDPRLTLVHLDDWAIQQGWDDENPLQIYEFLSGQNLRYYLRIPNERAHAINRRLRLDLLEEAGGLREIYRAGENVLYEIRPPERRP